MWQLKVNSDQRKVNNVQNIQLFNKFNYRTVKAQKKYCNLNDC